MSLPARTRSRRLTAALAGGAAPLLLAPTLPAQAQAVEATTYIVQAGDTLGEIAYAHGVPLSQLLRLNGLTATTIIHPGQVIRLSGTGTPATTAPTPTASGTITVRPGDGWWVLSERAGVDMATLQRINGMTLNTMLHPGMVLNTGLPATSAPAPSPAPTPAPAPKPAPAPSGVVVRHTAKAGETLWGLSQRYEVSIERIRELNGFTRFTDFHPGDVLLIKDGTEVEVVPTGPIGSTFLDYTYPTHVTIAANNNLRTLQSRPQPSPAQMQQIVRETALRMGVDPALALGHAYTESRFNHTSVSPANAIGTMQVIPITGEFASDLVGRELDLLDPYDNVTAGVALIRHLQAKAPTLELGIGAYYQGLGGVMSNGMRDDTRTYVARVKAAMAMF